MKKKHIIFFLFILAPFLCSVGISSWLISESVSFNPEYEILDVIKQYYDNQATTYETDEQFTAKKQQPTSSNTDIITDEIVQSKCTIMYRKNGQSQWSNNIPTNAGKYEIQYTYKNKSIIVNYTIKPSSFDVVEYGYIVESASLSAIIEGEQSKNRTGGALKDGTGTTISGTITYDTTLLTYPDSSNTSEIINTSVQWHSSDGNYYYDIPATVTMYAVAYNSSTSKYYGTVEKALSSAISGNKVWVLGNIQPTTGFYPTIKENCEIKSGVELSLSYSSSDYATGYLKTQTSSSGSNPSYLYIESGVTITNNGSIMVGACIYSTGSNIGSPAVIMNNGTINCNSGSNVFARGYIKGSGSVMANSGANIYQEFFIYDWPGGTNAYSLSNADLFPFQVFGFTNISCTLRVYYNSNLYAHCQVEAGDRWIMDKDLKLAGTSGLFELTGSASDHIDMSVEDTTSVTNVNTSLTASNRNKTIRNVFKLNGNFKDNSITVNVSVAGLINKDISTSTSIAMPIGFLKIIIQKGTGTLVNNSYKFLPGSSLEIEEGANIIVGTSGGTNLPQIIFFDETYSENFTYTNDGNILTASFYYQNVHTEWYKKYSGTETLGAQFICDGNFTCYGGFGGKINTTSENGKVVLSNNNASIYVCSNLTYFSGTTNILKCGASKKQEKCLALMHLYTNVGVSNEYNQVAAGTYYSIKDNNNKYGWRTTSLVLSYDLNGGVGTPPSDSDGKTVGSSGYIIQSSDIPTIVPTKEHYTFIGWALDLNGEELVETGTTTVYASTTLYAAWEAIPYTITYNNVFYDANDASLGNTLTTNPNVNTSDGKTTYTVADNPPLILKNPTLLNTNGNALVFGGWYSNAECTDKYLINTTQDIIGNVTIYAYWYPYGTKTVNVKFNLDVHENVKDLFPSGTISLTSEEAPFIGNVTTWKPTDYSSFNTNPSLPYYFMGWYLDSSYETLYSSSEMSNLVDDSTTTINLYAKIMPKIKVSYANAPNGFSYSIQKPSDYYILPNSTIEFIGCSPNNSESFSNDGNSKYLYSFNGFTINNETNIFNTSYDVGTYDDYAEIIITPNVTIKTYYKVIIESSAGLSNISGITDGEFKEAGTSFTISFTLAKGSGGILGLFSKTYSGSLKINNSVVLSFTSNTKYKQDLSYNVTSLSGPIILSSTQS